MPNHPYLMKFLIELAALICFVLGLTVMAIAWWAGKNHGVASPGHELRFDEAGFASCRDCNSPIGGHSERVGQAEGNASGE